MVSHINAGLNMQQISSFSREQNIEGDGRTSLNTTTVPTRLPIDVTAALHAICVWRTHGVVSHVCDAENEII